tara:strand:- start:2470 stop:3129 length:660 start_codon:yes stop_codon:yes gene_type:complete
MNIFVPIKANSQRVPNKNFRMFGKEPLYKHTLLKLFNHDVWVSTDCSGIIKAIKEDSRLSHVTPYLRRNDLCGDEVSVCSLISDWIETYQIKGIACQLHVTSPFLTVKTLEKAFKMFEPGYGYDSIFSCDKLQVRMWRNEKYGLCPVNHNPVDLKQTQDLPPYYAENSLFYFFKVKILQQVGNRIGVNPWPVETTFPENVDIDNESDWDFAQKLLEVIK